MFEAPAQMKVCTLGSQVAPTTALQIFKWRLLIRTWMIGEQSFPGDEFFLVLPDESV